MIFLSLISFLLKTFCDKERADRNVSCVCESQVSGKDEKERN